MTEFSKLRTRRFFETIARPM